MADHQEDTIQATPAPVWSASVRGWVSLILAFHLFCVVLAPLATVEPRAGLAVDLQRVVSPYSEALFLRHGYRFFAPEPGPSHVVHYEVTTRSGETIQGHFPDRWEHLAASAVPPLVHVVRDAVYARVGNTGRATAGRMANGSSQRDPGAVSQRLAGRPTSSKHVSAASWMNMRDWPPVRDQLVHDLGQFLLQRHDGISVDLKLVTRVIPPPEDIARGLRLDNERYLPAELQYDLGRVGLGSQELEAIEPPEPDQRTGGEGQG